MDKKEDNFEDGLHSQSLEGIESCSSSILESDEEDDGINITIKAVTPGGNAVESDLKLAGSERRKMKKMIVEGMDVDDARAKVISSTPKRSRNIALDSSNGAVDTKPDPKKVCGPADTSSSSAMKNAVEGGSEPPAGSTISAHEGDVVMQETVATEAVGKEEVGDGQGDGDQPGSGSHGSGDDGEKLKKKKKKKKKKNAVVAISDDTNKQVGGNFGGAGEGGSSGGAGRSGSSGSAGQGGNSGGAGQGGSSGGASGGGSSGSVDQGNKGKAGSSSSGARAGKKKSGDTQSGGGSKKPRRGNLPAPTSAQIASRVRLGIIPTGYPDVELTADQQEIVKEELLKRVLQQRKELFKPKFVYCKARTGHLMLICQDKDTASWVKHTFSTITPWENAQLCALEEDNIPRKVLLLGFFYRSNGDDDETIRGYLESQNDNLDTSAWRVLHRTVKNDHVNWVFTVDSASMQLLEEREFIVNYKFGQTQFYKKSENVNRPDVEDMDEEMEVYTFNEGLLADDQRDQLILNQTVGVDMTLETESLASSGNAATVGKMNTHNNYLTGEDINQNPRALNAQGSDGVLSSENNEKTDLSGKDSLTNPRALIAQGSEGDPSRLEIINNQNQGFHQPIKTVPKEPQDGGKTQQ